VEQALPGPQGLVGPTGSSGNIDLSVLTATSSTERQDNWSPSGWPGSLIKVIDYIPNMTNKISIISGLSSGVPGRIVTLENSSVDNLVILEKGSTFSSASNRFNFFGRSGYFLYPGEVVTLLHDGTKWNQFSGNMNNGHDIFDDFAGVGFPPGVVTGNTSVGASSPPGTGT